MKKKYEKIYIVQINYINLLIPSIVNELLTFLFKLD